MSKIKHFDVMPDIIAANRVRTFVEVGVYHGKFSKLVLRKCGCYLDQYWAIDRWDVLVKEEGTPIGGIPAERWNELYLGVCAMMTHFPMLHVIRQDSLTASTLFPDGYFDMVYIDASHFYEDVLADIKAWLPKVRPGGIMSGHDYVHRRANMQAKKAVDEMFPTGVITLEDTVWMVKL